LIIGPDGQPVVTETPTVDERAFRSEVMA
jgi:hypothetical protein